MAFIVTLSNVRVKLYKVTGVNKFLTHMLINKGREQKSLKVCVVEVLWYLHLLCSYSIRAEIKLVSYTSKTHIAPMIAAQNN